MSDENDDDDAAKLIVTLTANVVAAFVGKNNIAVKDLPEVVDTVRGSLGGMLSDYRSGKFTLGKKSKPNTRKAKSEPIPKPAVPIDQSIMPEYLVCLEDGKQMKMLKSYLRSNYRMTPDEYRKKWNLPKDYPMTAPEYSKRCGERARKYDFGYHPGGNRRGRPRTRSTTV